MFKYKDKQQLLMLYILYSVTVQSIAEQPLQVKMKLFGQQYFVHLFTYLQ